LLDALPAGLFVLGAVLGFGVQAIQVALNKLPEAGILGKGQALAHGLKVG
jgi:hypothetical protein